MSRRRRATCPRVQMIASAHTDLFWLWRRDEGRRDVLDTARTVVALMDEYPEMAFTFAQAQSYLWVEEDDPALFESIKGLVADGRWHIGGGMDCYVCFGRCNLPAEQELVAAEKAIAVLGAAGGDSPAGADARVIVRGPAHVSRLVARHYGHSLVGERVSLCAGQRAIGASTWLDCHETHQALKVSYPVAVTRAHSVPTRPTGSWTRGSRTSRTGC